MGEVGAGGELYDVFISYASADGELAEQVRILLAEGPRLRVWKDSRGLRAGAELAPEICAAIERSRHLVVLASPAALNSPWVDKEVRHALGLGAPANARSSWVERLLQRFAPGRAHGAANGSPQGNGASGPKVIPVLLDGLKPQALAWFREELLCILLRRGPGAMEELRAELLPALGLAAPRGPARVKEVEARPQVELVLELSEPVLQQEGSVRRVTARAVVRCEAPGVESVVSPPFRFSAPLGPIEAEDLAWYLERYWRWPIGIFEQRARDVEAALPHWGQALYAAAFETSAAREAVRAWQQHSAEVSGRASAERGVSVLVDEALLAGAESEEQARAKQAASALLALPWELLHDGQGYVCQGARAARVRRRLPSRVSKDPLVTDPPLRVLLVSPRPEDQRAAYIDHRASARPLVEALNELGSLAELQILQPPTFAALQAELNRAAQAGKPYHVVHFDGHGVYDRARAGAGGRLGLGALVFEDPAHLERLEGRGSELRDAAELAELMRERRVPLFVLDACQSAQTEVDPTASVAGSLLQGGVASVVAMSHSVLVETTRRLTRAFYESLLAGERVGRALLQGQQALWADAKRGRGFSGELELQDWFVPVLFQEQADPQLVRALPAPASRAGIDARALGDEAFPKPAGHGFVGRSRALLAAERLLCRSGRDAPRYLVLRGDGGEGKTALACELARWLVASHRFRRAAFASLEEHGHARALLAELGSQLVPGFDAAWTEERQRLELERALGDASTLVVIDNVESVLLAPEAVGARGSSHDDGAEIAEAAAESRRTEAVELEQLLALCEDLARIGGTRLVFTSRESLPPPFAQHEQAVGRLERQEAIALVAELLRSHGLAPRASEQHGEGPIEDLVEAVGCHARSLVLITPELPRSGVLDTTRQLHDILAQLDRRHPNDRERSLFASVELSLRRLPAELRAKIAPLGLFQGGGWLVAIAMVLRLDIKKGEAQALVEQLERVGLAEPLAYGYLRLDPALGPYLLRELGAAEAATRLAWAQTMTQEVRFLYEQYFKDTKLATTLTALDLPNLLAALEYRCERGDDDAPPGQGDARAARSASAEDVVDMATSVEALVAPLGRARPLARVVALRRRAAANLGSWGHAQFEAARSEVERLLERGRTREAVSAAQALLQRSLAAGETAYGLAAYDIALASATLGRSLKKGGNPERALEPLDEAERRFRSLVETGNGDAAQVVSACLGERADCLRQLGQLELAVEGYEAAIRQAEKQGDTRSATVHKFQLGSVRLLQGRYPEALDAYQQARTTLAQLDEPASVATAWYQIGMVHRRAEQFDAAETAYQAALTLHVQLRDRAAEAGTLLELGNLYMNWSRAEDAVSLYRQAAEIYASPNVNNLMGEGCARSNAANQLLQLERYQDARTEILRAIECELPFGDSASPWMSFNILSRLERASGNPEAANRAWRQALEAYLAYRRRGGYPSRRGEFAQLCAHVAEAVQASETSELLGGARRDCTGPKYVRRGAARFPRPLRHPRWHARPSASCGSRDKLRPRHRTPPPTRATR